jgi:hypothetical protein
MHTTARCDAGLAARLSISPTRVRFPSASLIRLGVMLVLQSGSQPSRTNPGIRARSVPGSIPVRVAEECSQVVEYWRAPTVGWSARRSERRAHCGRGSSSLPLATDGLQVGWDPTGFHTAGEPGSIPGPATDKRCGWASAHSGLISLDCRCATPGPATDSWPSTQTGKANRPRSCESAGSTPASVT